MPNLGISGAMLLSLELNSFAERDRPGRFSAVDFPNRELDVSNRVQWVYAITDVEYLTADL